MIALKKLVTLAEAIFDNQRLQIIKLLQIREMCVCELAESLDLSSPRMSQHLAVLRREKIVKERRDGKWIYYALVPKTLEEFSRLWNALVDQPMKDITEMRATWKRYNSADLDQVKQACGKAPNSSKNTREKVD